MSSVKVTFHAKWVCLLAEFINICWFYLAGTPFKIIYIWMLGWGRYPGLIFSFTVCLWLVSILNLIAGIMAGNSWLDLAFTNCQVFWISSLEQGSQLRVFVYWDQFIYSRLCRARRCGLCHLMFVWYLTDHFISLNLFPHLKKGRCVCLLELLWDS